MTTDKRAQKQSETHREQQPDLGQKKARAEKESESKLSKMGETSREPEQKKSERHSD